MKNILIVLVLLVLAVILPKCGTNSSVSSTDGSGSNNSGWLVSQNEVVDGGPGKDGIPSIDNPQFITVSQEQNLTDSSLVLGVMVQNVIHIYPLDIMNWHEIVNDTFSKTPVTLSYCPLTGTGIAWKRTVGGKITTFGVSGLLYRNNLIPYDRSTNSLWSQMLEESINGSRIGDNLQTIHVIQASWGIFKKAYPNAKVLSRQTGYSRDYGLYPYGDYRTNNNYFLFPTHTDFSKIHTALPAKTIVLGVNLGTKHIAYPVNQFDSALTVINDMENHLVIAGSSNDKYAFAYKNTLGDGTELSFRAIQDSLPLIMQDQEGNKWTLFGTAAQGPRKGSQLQTVNSFSAYWFAWLDFFTPTRIRTP